MKLRDILLEQSNKFDAKAVADKIYNAKGYVYDNEQEAINAVKSIKDINQLEQVEDKFIELSEGRTISEYLISFLDNFKQNFTVLNHLYSISKNNRIALESLVYPYAAELIYEYKRDIARVGSDIQKKQGQTNTVGLKDAGLLFDWFKPYLGEANFKKWVPIVQDPQYIDNPFNAYQAEEQFKYGKTKAVSSSTILVGQLIVGIIATVASGGLAAPAVVGWLALGTATGMGLYDAAQEYNLGNKQTAGIMAAIEVLPLVSKIPGVKQAVRTVGKSLATKLAAGSKYLTSQERFLANQLAKYEEAIQAELKELEKTVKNQGDLPSSMEVPSSVKTGKEDIPLQKIYGTGSGVKIGTYGKTAVGNPQAVFGIINDSGLSKYIGYYAVKDGAETIYKLTTKMEWEGEGFKRVLTAISKILPDHILFESTSISTDAIKWWHSQIKNGYKPTSKTFEVPLNNAGVKLKVTKPTNFADALLSKEEAELAIETIEKQDWFKRIPGAKLTIGPQETSVRSAYPVFKIEVTLPELQSTTKSLNNLGIARSMIAPAVADKLNSKE